MSVLPTSISEELDASSYKISNSESPFNPAFDLIETMLIRILATNMETP